MKMDQLAKGLDTGDHAGHHVFPLEHVAGDFENAFPSRVCEQAE